MSCNKMLCKKHQDKRSICCEECQGLMVNDIIERQALYEQEQARMKENFGKDPDIIEIDFFGFFKSFLTKRMLQKWIDTLKKE